MIIAVQCVHFTSPLSNIMFRKNLRVKLFGVLATIDIVVSAKRIEIHAGKADLA